MSFVQTVLSASILLMPLVSFAVSVPRDAGRVVVVKTGATYKVINNNKFPIVQITFGDEYATIPYFKGVPPANVVAPNGWTGYAVTEEESDRYFFLFEATDPKYAIAPGAALGGFGGFNAPVNPTQEPPSSDAPAAGVPFEAVDSESNKITGIIVAPWRVLYEEHFNYHPQQGAISELDKWGFVRVSNWFVARVDDGSATHPFASGYMQSTGPGGWAGLSSAYSPPLAGANWGQSEVKMEWRVLLPTAYGPSWRENNKVVVSFSDLTGRALYSLAFKPNREQDRYTSPDLILYRDKETDRAVVLKEGSTHTLTPHGSTAKWLRFLTRFLPDGSIKVSYDNGSGVLKEHLSAKDNTYRQCVSLLFQYKTGSSTDKYWAAIDDIKVTAE